MSIVICGNQITPYNSTTYVDLLGILVGPDRSPRRNRGGFHGSDTPGRKDGPRLRLHRANERDRSRIGLQMQQAIHISDNTGSFEADSSIAGVHLKNAERETTIPILVDLRQFLAMGNAVVCGGANQCDWAFHGHAGFGDGPALTVVKQSAEGL